MKKGGPIVTHREKEPVNLVWGLAFISCLSSCYVSCPHEVEVVEYHTRLRTNPLSLSLSVVVSLLLYLKHSFFFSSSSSSVSFSVIMLVHLALASHAAGVIYTLSHPQHRFASTDSAPPTLKQQEVTKPSLYMWFFLLSLSTNHQQRGQRRLEGEITAKMHGKLFLTPWKITRKKRKEKKKFGFPRRRRYIRQ